MKAIFDYIISSFLFSLIAVPFVILFRYKNYKKGADFKKEAAIMLFFMSATLIFCQTAIPPQFMSGNFTLSAFHSPDFSTYLEFPYIQLGWIKWMLTLKEYSEIVINIGGNLIIFIPIGFLAPYIWKNLKAKAILIGFLLSCFVEFIQLFTDRTSDYNDIILNTIGTAIGYVLCLIIKKIHNKRASS